MSSDFEKIVAYAAGLQMKMEGLPASKRKQYEFALGELYKAFPDLRSAVETKIRKVISDEIDRYLGGQGLT